MKSLNDFFAIRNTLRPALLSAAAAVLFLATGADAKDWLVKADGSGEAATIQAAIDAASSVPGQDRVVLEAGTYTGTGNYDIRLNKPITLTSASGAAATIIDFQDQRGIVVESMTGDATISNLTLTNALHIPDGGAIHCDGENPTISGCVISNNRANRGAGIFLANAAPLIELCTITGNSTTGGNGAGIAVSSGSNPTIDRCTISFNQTTSDGRGVGIWVNGATATITNNRIHDNESPEDNGGGICMSYASGVYTINNNVIYNNRAVYGGGLLIKSSSGGIVHNNTIVNNYCKNLGGGLLTETSTLTVSHTIVAFNTGGNAVFCFDSNPTLDCLLVYNPGSDNSISCQQQNMVFADPAFCGSVASGNFELQSDSPATAANSPCGQVIGALDIGCGSTPTFLASHGASVRDGGIALEWSLSEAGQGMEYFITREEIDASFLTSVDVSTIERDDLDFELFDAGVEAGKSYRYRVEVDDELERRILFVTRDLTVPGASAYLYPAQPNPFNPQTRIRYDVAVAGPVLLNVYDVDGRLVSTLYDGERGVGAFDATWNGTNLEGARVASGVYFYRLQTAGLVLTGKMVLAK